MTGELQLSEVIDASGRRLRLGRKLGQGGEGAVFELDAERDFVAKIYRQPLAPERVEKIRRMALLRTEQIDRLTAWPREVLSLPSGKPIGLKMAKVVDHKDIHQLYSPKSRRMAFLRADWRFLVRTAANLARAFATVHGAQGVIADVNHAGVLVSQDARVRLIDCDSFQIAVGGKLYLCDVGVPTFTSPELQGRAFGGVVRTANHDNFGLAVLIFLILFMGRHPFAGRYLGEGEMPVERAIEEYRFAYSADAEKAEMRPPPGTPPLAIVSSEIAAMFERAFGRDGASAGRPTAALWAEALDRLESRLKECRAGVAHWYLGELEACPWCRMEASTGVPLFSSTVSKATAGQFDLKAFWVQIEALEHPGAAPVLFLPKEVELSADAHTFRRRRWVHLPLSLLIASIPFALAMILQLPTLARLFFLVSAIVLFVLVRKVLRASYNTEPFIAWVMQCRARWDEARREWELKAGPRLFDDRRMELDELRAAWTSIADFRSKKVQELAVRRHETQLHHFLDGFELEAGVVRRVGTGRTSTLASFGIETAADITEQKLQAISGLSDKARGQLLGWRRSLEAQFIFDPEHTIAPRDEAWLGEAVLAERLRLEAAIRRGFTDLQQIHKQILFARTALQAKTEEAYRICRQAELDLEAIQS